jgi:hypothetical protein
VTVAVGGGLGLALVSTAALNWGFLRQHGAASSLPPLTVRRPLRALRALFSDLRWLAGFTVGLLGWALYVAALRVAPLSLVQAVSAGGIGLLAVLIDRTTGVRLSGREWGGVAVAVTGLALLGVSLMGQVQTGRHGSPVALSLWIAVSVLAAVVAAGPLASRLVAGAGFGLAAGLLYAAGDVATKAAVVGGTAALFALAVLACHGLAFTTLQLGFQRGGALATVGVATLLTNALPIGAGTTVFREGLPASTLGAVRVLAFACVVCGAAVLAGSGSSAEPGLVRPAPEPSA